MDDRAITVEEDEVKRSIHSACRMLAIREHSIKQLEVKLADKGFSDTAVEHCISYLLDEDWLSETRFCNVFIRSKSERGQGLQRIVMELKQHGIAQQTIEQQLAIELIDWQKLCEKVLAKKIRISGDSSTAISIEKEPMSETSLPLNQQESGWQLKSNRLKQRKKLQSFLQTRGFSHQEIYKALDKRFKKPIKIE